MKENLYISLNFYHIVQIQQYLRNVQGVNYCVLFTEIKKKKS